MPFLFRRSFRRNRIQPFLRLRVWVLLPSVAALLTPPDPISQIALALPTVLLYELSIYAVKLAEKQRAAAGSAATAVKPA